jgi:predicted N-acetyltransferase YhbS
MPQRSIQARDAVAGAAITVRPATPADVDALLAVINPAYKRADGHIFPHATRVDREDLLGAIASGHLAVAEIDGAIAGSIEFDTSANPAHFGPLATAIEYQRRGVARALIAHAEAAAREAGGTVMRLEAIREVGWIPFYEALGYVAVRETPGDVWTDGSNWGAVRPWTMVEMEKRL